MLKAISIDVVLYTDQFYIFFMHIYRKIEEYFEELLKKNQ